jgi:hypothetical protein
MRNLKPVLTVLVSISLVLTGSLSAQAKSDLSIDNLNYNKVGKAAFAEVNSYLKGRKIISGRAEFVTSPNVMKREVKTETDLVNKSVTIFSKWYLPSKFKVVMFTEKDGSWADEALVKHGGQFPTRLSSEIDKWSKNGGLCNFAFATRSSDGTPVYYECTDSTRTRDWTNLQNPPHEYFHLVQQQYGRLPIWLHEGSATFFGAAIGHNKLSPNGKKSKDFYMQTGANFDPDNQGFDHTRLSRLLRTLTTEQSVKMFRDLEEGNWDRGQKLAHYGLGALATEVLIAVWGLDKYMTMLKNAGYDSVNWKASFQATYGLTTDEFYAKLTPYLRTVGAKHGLR